MKIIAAQKDNTLFYGSVTKVANKVGINPITITRWIKAQKDYEFKKGFQIFINTEKL